MIMSLMNNLINKFISQPDTTNMPDLESEKSAAQRDN